MEEPALRELRDSPASRKKFLKMVGAGGAGGLALLIAACGDDKPDDATSGQGTPPSSDTTSGATSSPFGKGDLGIAGYALTLEYLEADFYSQAAGSGMLKGQALELGKEFGEQEQQHVDALEKLIKSMNGKLPAKPKGRFPLDSQAAILDLAATVENLGASAYLGAAGLIESPDVLAAALSIHTVEARHASTLNQVLGKPNTPDGAFAKPTTMDEVLKTVKPFIA
jgi:rubrerythrin